MNKLFFDSEVLSPSVQQNMVPVQQNMVPVPRQQKMVPVQQMMVPVQQNTMPAQQNGVRLTMGSHEIITLEPLSDPWAEGMP